LRFRPKLFRIENAPADKSTVNLGQFGVGERVIGINGYCLFIITSGFLHRSGSLVTIKESLKHHFISLRIDGLAFRKLLLFACAEAQPKLPGNLFGNLRLYSK